MAEGHRSRQRAKIRVLGVESMHPKEILEFVLFPFFPRVDTSPLATRLMEKFGCLDNIFSAKMKDLVLIGELPEAVAMYIACMRPIIVRSRTDFIIRKGVFDCPKITKEYFIERLSFVDHEELHVMFLDVHFGFLSADVLFDGSVASAKLDVRRLVRLALACGAQKVILAHNHPGLDRNPSKDDLRTTEDIGKILAGFGIELIDHIIVVGGSAVSLWQTGYMVDTGGKTDEKDENAVYTAKIQQNRIEVEKSMSVEEEISGVELADTNPPKNSRSRNARKALYSPDIDEL